MLLKVIGLACLASCMASGQDTIFFSRDFPGAAPAHFEVTLGQDGSVSYLETDEVTEQFRISEHESKTVFELASDLDFFSQPLASDRQVASTGEKVLRYESEGQLRGEQSLNYTENSTARDVIAWFVKLAETRRHLHALERVFRFDRLGINKALVSLEQSFDRNRIVAPGQLVEILTKISGQDRIVHLARARADGLLERIQNQQ